MANQSTDNKNSRYVQGGITDVYSNKLGWWERTPIPYSDDDIMLTIDLKYSGRPSLLAYDLYGKDTLMWIVLQYNNIVDIEEEFVEGKEIRAPRPERVFFQILNKTQDSNYIK